MPCRIASYLTPCPQTPQVLPGYGHDAFMPAGYLRAARLRLFTITWFDLYVGCTVCTIQHERVSCCVWTSRLWAVCHTRARRLRSSTRHWFRIAASVAVVTPCHAYFTPHQTLYILVRVSFAPHRNVPGFVVALRVCVYPLPL